MDGFERDQPGTGAGSEVAGTVLPQPGPIRSGPAMGSPYCHHGNSYHRM
jgi:hypothetical protein